MVVDGVREMPKVAIIGGTGLASVPAMDLVSSQDVTTPYGEPSAPLATGTLFEMPVVFLARHGNPHRLSPHRINYRANLDALRTAGVTHVIALAAVGGITPNMAPAAVVVPDQIIDYTYGREHTFFDGVEQPLQHIDFTSPYSASIRDALIGGLKEAGLPILDKGVYGATQGPRLETPAEIQRMERDGCDLVGMTGMPEAALAREAGLEYGALAVVANWAAGKFDGEITMADIEQALEHGMADALRVIRSALATLQG